MKRCPQKVFLRLRESQCVAGHPPLAATAVKVAAAAGEDSLEVHGVRLGDSARQERAKGRYGDSGCLGGPLLPSLAGCRGHRGPQQDRGYTPAFREPPAGGSTQHRSGSCFHLGACNAPPNQAAAQTSRGGCSHRVLREASERQPLAAPGWWRSASWKRRMLP